MVGTAGQFTNQRDSMRDQRESVRNDKSYERQTQPLRNEKSYERQAASYS